MTNYRSTPEYSTILFTQVWDNDEDFLKDYSNQNTKFVNKIPALLDTTTATTLFYLLYARYGNSPIAFTDINQFKYRIFSIIWQYGPTWEKKLEIQEALRGLTADQIQQGSKAIYNQALNPNTSPSTSSLDELTYINSQNTTNYKKGPLDGYAALNELLATDLTDKFLKKFQICFKRFISSEKPLLFITEETEEDDGN